MLISCVLFVLVVAAAYEWGLPVAAEIGARHLPPAFSRVLTTQTLRVLDGGLLKESKLSVQRQAALTSRFRALKLPGGGVPNSELLFRRSPQLGSNAFTLPDGTIILLDDLVTSMKDDRPAIVQAKYLQKLEQEADDYGAALLIRNAMSPALLADALSPLVASHPEASKGGYLSSHPPTDARMKRLRDRAAAAH